MTAGLISLSPLLSGTQKGENPVKVLLTNAQLVEIRNSLLEFNVLIPAEPLAVEGDMIFVIDGYVDGKKGKVYAGQSCCESGNDYK